MTGRARAAYLVASLAAAAGCSAGTERGRASAAPPASESDRMLAMIEDSCGSCHDAGLQPPMIGANVLTDRRLAIDVALMVSANRMPPPPAVLAPHARTALVTWSCAVGRAAPNCTEGVLADARPSELVRDPRFVVAALAPRLPAATGPAPAHDPLAMLRALDLGVTAFHLHPTYGALLVLVAATRCRTGATVDAACVQTVLGGEPLALPPAPAAIGAD